MVQPKNRRIASEAYADAAVANSPKIAELEQKNASQDTAITAAKADAIADATTKYGELPTRLEVVEQAAVFDGDDRLLSYHEEDGTLFALTDTSGRFTDIELDMAGKIAPIVMDRWQHRILPDVTTREYDEPDAILALVSEAGQFTDLHYDASGQVADEVMHRWSKRLEIIQDTGGAFNTMERVSVGGKVIPMYPDTTQVTGWGSSSMRGIGPYLVEVFPNATFRNEGQGGEKSQHIAARMGAIPAQLSVAGGSIPTSGPVTVASGNVPPSANLRPFTGTLSGIGGTLSSTATELAFTRTSPGSATPVPDGTPFISDLGNASRQHVTLLWPGKNNTGDEGASALVIEQTAAMFEWLSPFVKRCLVLTHFVDSHHWVGTTQWENIRAINEDYLERYGDLAVDVNAYILSSQVWADTGLTPTVKDLEQQASGVKPESLSSDLGHLNAAGYAAVAAFIQKHIDRLNWR